MNDLSHVGRVFWFSSKASKNEVTLDVDVVVLAEVSDAASLNRLTQDFCASEGLESANERGERRPEHARVRRAAADGHLVGLTRLKC